MAKKARPFKEVLREQLQIMIDKIIAEQSRLGIKDRGISASSLKIKGSRALNAVITATEYLQTNYQGIGTQPKGIGKSFIDNLMQWTKLRPRGKQTRKQAAFAVARSIVKRGSAIKRGAQAINIKQITKETAEEIAKHAAENERLRMFESIENIRYE